jgi:hypothetical protein
VGRSFFFVWSVLFRKVAGSLSIHHENFGKLLPVQLNARILAIGPGVKNPCESQVWYLFAMIRSHNVREDFSVLLYLSGSVIYDGRGVSLLEGVRPGGKAWKRYET